MKGLFIPEITAEMFKNGCLESIETLMAEGEIYDIDYQEPCEDAISRQAVLKQLKGCLLGGETEYKYVKLHIDSIPPAISQPKTGHWIDIMVGDMPAQACDRCNTFYPLAYTGGGHKYCPNCGAKMESEG